MDSNFWEKSEVEALLSQSLHQPNLNDFSHQGDGKLRDIDRLTKSLIEFLNELRKKRFYNPDQLKDIVQMCGNNWAFCVRKEGKAILCSSAGRPSQPKNPLLSIGRREGFSQRCGCRFGVRYKMCVDTSVQITKVCSIHTCAISVQSFYKARWVAGLTARTSPRDALKETCKLILKDPILVEQYMKRKKGLCKDKGTRLRKQPRKQGTRASQPLSDDDTTKLALLRSKKKGISGPVISPKEFFGTASQPNPTQIECFLNNLQGFPHCSGLNLENEMAVGAIPSLMKLVVKVLCHEGCQIWYLNLDGIIFPVDSIEDGSSIDILIKNLPYTKVTHFYGHDGFMTKEQKQAIFTALKLNIEAYPPRDLKTLGTEKVWKIPKTATTTTRESVSVKFLDQIDSILDPKCPQKSLRALDTELKLRVRVALEKVGSVSNRNGGRKIPPFPPGGKLPRMKDVFKIYFNNSIDQNVQNFTPWFDVKKSEIKAAGLGVFAARSFNKKDIIAVFVGDLKKCVLGKKKKEHFVLHWKDANVNIDSRGWVVKGFPSMGIQMANDPNYNKKEKDKDQSLLNCRLMADLTVIATKDIEQGDEIYWDYNY